jgi:mediator of RNA polymerase II transcription subunit 14
LLRRIIEKHTKAILKAFRTQLQRGIARAVFSPPGVVSLVKDGTFISIFSPTHTEPSFKLQLISVQLSYSFMFVGDTHALQTHLVADEMAITTIDPRTGRMNLRDTGDLAAAGRGPRFTAITEKLNENPTILLEALVRLRHNVSKITTFFFYF